MKILSEGYLLRDDGVIEINPDVVYSKLMGELGFDEEQLDQYKLGVIYKCAVLDAERLVQGTEHELVKFASVFAAASKAASVS